MKNNITELVFILDRSGSMSGLESDTIGGFNALIEKQKKQDGDCYVSTVLFDDESEVVIEETEAFTEEKTPSIQETVTEKGAEITEETIITEPEEETVEYIDEGDQSLAEYKPHIGQQPNPFENDIPTEIDDRPVEDYVGEGEDRPGEGIHF